MEKYNGWSNRETWLVKLWLDNTPEAFSFQGKKSQEAHELSEFVDELLDEKPVDGEGIGGLAEDLLQTALARVNWQEIVEALND